MTQGSSVFNHEWTLIHTNIWMWWGRSRWKREPLFWGSGEEAVDAGDDFG